MTDSRFFYRDLPVLGHFPSAVEVQQHTPVPEDWWIVIADVVDSTRAIESGQYKAVNTVGAACITAVLNVDRALDIPFMFGGDGATLVIPDCAVDAASTALRGAQRLARESFGLQLRVGLIQVGTLASHQFWVLIAKLRLSKHLTQATFSGRGWDEAERRVKAANAPGVIYLNENDGPAEANFEGFECRWEAVSHFNGHKLSLLVAATSPRHEENLATYQAVAKRIESIYGDVVSYHPLRARALRLSFSLSDLRHEWRVRSGNRSIAHRLGYLLRMLLQNLAGRFLFATNRDTRTVRWSHYRDELVDNTDFRKFDGMLRMVMDGSDTQAEELARFLDAQHQSGRLAYGMYKSQAALITCFVRSHNGQHLHFVDGSDGGYALAAKGLKKQLRSR